MSKVDAFRDFLLDEDGTETLEWGIVCFVIVVGAIVAIRAIAPKIKTMWTNVNASVK